MFGALIAIIGAIAAPSLAVAQDRGLHNSSKVFSDPVDVSWRDWFDPREMERSWRAALVRVPAGKGRSKLMTTGDLHNERTGIEGKIPTVIYMHGCSGIWPGTHLRTEFLAENGFLVIAPASLAREKYPGHATLKRGREAYTAAH